MKKFTELWRLTHLEKLELRIYDNDDLLVDMDQDDRAALSNCKRLKKVTVYNCILGKNVDYQESLRSVAT